MTCWHPLHGHDPGENRGASDQQHAHGRVDRAGQDDLGQVSDPDALVDDHADKGRVEHGDHRRLGDPR